MDMSLFLMLLLSGLLSSTSGLLRDYQYVNTAMSWSSAQSYCRERFTDLATVDSMNDVNVMMNSVNDGYSGSVWIGLKRMTQNGWVWSNGDGPLAGYTPWWGSEPSGDGKCVFFVHTSWYDYPCANVLDFVCYNDTSGYVLITDRKSWSDALSYCRQHHTDLASMHALEELNKIVLIAGETRWVWIGLSSGSSWQWSDQWSIFFSNWAAGQPSESGDCVAMTKDDYGKWTVDGCDLQYPFICYEEAKFVKKQTVRLYFIHDGTNSLNDSVILDKIRKALMGLEGFENLSWRKKDDGEVFHLIEDTVDSDNICYKNL